MRPAVTAAIDDEPMPPGRGRRWGFGAGVLVVLLVATWCAWDRIAWHRFNAEVARLHAAGAPVWETDFPRIELVDSENATVLLRRAAQEYVQTPEELSHEQSDFFEVPLAPEAVDVLGRILEANRAALEDVRRARSLSAVATWEPPTTIEQFVHGHRVELLNHARALAQLLAYATRHAHATGDDRAAVRFIEGIMGVGRVTDADESIVPHFIAQGMLAMASEEVESLAPELHAGNGPREAPRSEVDALIGELLESNARLQSLRRAIEHERPAIASPATDEFTGQFRHLYAWSDAGDISFSLAPYALDAATDRIVRPMLLLRAARLLHYDADAAANALAADSGALPPAVNPAPRDPLHVLEMFGVHWVIELRLSDWDLSQAFRNHRAVTTDNARAAACLAARLYQIDHGRMPATNASLVPEYLPSVPPGVPTIPAYMTRTKAAGAIPYTLPSTAPAATQPAPK